MDWRKEAEGDTLELILALLVSFAAIAERAAVLPLAMQLSVLSYVTRAEAVARSFVVGLPSGELASLGVSDATDRAERLAEDFRALALVLRAMLARARRRARLFTRQPGPAVPPRTLAEGRTRRVAALPAPDTS